MGDNDPRREIIGLIPAAGRASRISPLPCSKEIYPIGLRAVAGEGVRPKVAAHYLLEKMRFAGIRKAYVILRSGKWDIPAYFGDGSIVDMHLAYLPLEASPGVPFTLDRAYPFIKHATVAFGFPDILFDGEDGFARLVSRCSASGADLMLGLFPANHPSKEDTVRFNEREEVEEIVLRPSASTLRYTWGIAVWTPSFTEFLHEYVAAQNAEPAGAELSVGHAIKAAMEAGLRASALILDETPYLDIGTPEDLARALLRQPQVEKRLERPRGAGGEVNAK